MKIMVDQCLVKKSIVTSLEKVSAFNTKTIEELGYRHDTADSVLVQGTKSHRRILLTKNFKDINERKYPPCNHGGIIIVHAQETEADYIIRRIKALLKPATKNKVKGHVTHLYKERMVIYTHKETIEVNFDENPEIRKLVKKR